MERAKTNQHCVNVGTRASGTLVCPNVPGTPGKTGRPGQNGGYAGKSGDGGNAGHLTLYVKRIRGNMVLKTCPGKGAPAAINGAGGTAPDTPGTDGEVTSDFIQKFKLTSDAKNKYPLVLLKLMKRHAEDLIWSNEITQGEKVFKFLARITEDRDDAADIRKAAQRRLGFLNKEGFDRFGRNKLFAPQKKCSALKKKVESVRDIALYFQRAYNEIQEEMDKQDDLKKVLKALPQATTAQVRAQKQNLEAARDVSIKEKGLYVTGITDLEGRMENFLTQIMAKVRDVYEKAKFSKGDLIAVLQSITGFVKAAAGKDLFGALETALNTAAHFATQCSIGSLQEVKDKLTKWLTFGEAYKALEDSNDLDFETMDIASIPELMKADLEMKQEGLAAGLVCLLEERALPRDKAPLEELIANFFIAGSARIDLIAKIIDIDNDIGTFNFDINNLEETANAIESIGNSPEAPIAENIQQNLLDNLLQTYRQMENRFAKKLYYYYKSFEFQSLWDVEGKIAEYQRTASGATDSTGKLQGVSELQKAIAEIDKLESAAQNCYTSYRVNTDYHKWTFDSTKNKAMFDELYNGRTRFQIKMSDSTTMYNMRLLKMYVELYSNDDPSQDDNIPGKVYLRLRHLSSSYFKDGTGNNKAFRQKVGSERTFQFDRFEITDTAKCKEGKKKGEKNPIYCMAKSDSRFTPMCCHDLSDLKCEGDLQLGAEACKSLFGTYELSMPIDDTLDCTSSADVVTDKNCKDFQRNMFTKMNVWISYFYWSDGYPTGPDDGRCTNKDKPSKSKVPWSKRVPSLEHKPKRF
ncbi:hypothetical protein ACROYT_G027992 [Oculina patagonica]